MKVALFITGQNPEDGGGYTFENQLLEIILQLRSTSRHTFILYVSSQKIPTNVLDSTLQIVPLYLCMRDKIKLKLVGWVKNSFQKILHPTSKFIIQEWREQYILNSLKANQIDVILSLIPNCPTVEYPCITTVWDLQHKLQPYFPEVSGSGEWDARENFYVKMLRRAAFIITGTETGKAEIERFYQVPAERIKVIPFCAPQFASTSHPIDRDIASEYHLPNRYLFYPAQFWPHKNHIGLLLAIKYLNEKYDLEFSLVLVGADKGNESYVREMVRDLDLSQQVYFLGFVPRADLELLYRHAFALCFMTFFGPDNLPPLEAMALGCPVIASNVSGAKEQLGDAALLVDPKQPAEIAMAIKSLLEDSILRQNMIERGLKRANQWTAKDCVREIFSIIDDFEPIRRCWK